MVDATKSRAQLPISLDAERCSLCEICVRFCPADAFRVSRTERELLLHFTPSSCTVCEVDNSCQSECPEQAIQVLGEVAGGASTQELQVAQSELLRCTYCDELFAPELKVQALSQQGRTRHQPQRELCPVCRRKHLVVKYIEEERTPGQKAEYRSGNDILRRAGYGPDTPAKP